MRYTSRWKRGSEHSIPHVAAAVVGLCVHGDNVRSCILRLFAFRKKTKTTRHGTDAVVGPKHAGSRNVDLDTRERIVVNRLLEICLRRTM